MAVTIKTTQHGNSYCPQVQFVVDFVSETGGEAKYNWELKWVTFGYTVSSSASKAYNAKIDGTTVASGSFAIGGKTTQVIKSGTCTINKGTSSRTVPISLSFDMTFTWSGTGGGTKTASGSFNIAAKTSYVVSYNANGGSGAPGNQTKWYGTNLKLSSSVPSRTGHNFVRWNTNTSNTGTAYSPGGTYSANAGATLYAIWSAHTYTVQYNANGGTGAPGNQTKTYGVNLTLSSTKPTRTNYNFKGWSTSANGGVVYAAGATYTNNSAVTLYAVWELAYQKPRISNFTATRCTSNGTVSETGTYIKVAFNWSTDRTVSGIGTQHKIQSGSSWTGTSLTASGTSGSISQVIGGNNISIETSYHVRVYVTDSGGTTYSPTLSIGTVKFPIDVKAEGKGIAFGKVAELDDRFDVAWKALFRNDIVINERLTKAYRGWISSDKTIKSFNDATTTGIYEIDQSATDGPLNTWGYLDVQVANGDTWNKTDNWIWQTFYTTDGAIYKRYAVNNGSFTSWNRSVLAYQPIRSSANKGSWNQPTSGLLTQITDNSGAQHSVIVGLKSDGKTRAYGIDFLDNDSSPHMRLYSGSKYFSVQSDGVTWNGDYILALHSHNMVANTAGSKSHIQLGSLKLCWGKVSITPTANAPTSAAITFPLTYTNTPTVFTTPETTVPGTAVTGCASQNITTTGCNIFVTRTNTTTTNIMWFAIGS